ncbi:hypothetical protein ACJ7VE_24060, partial [Streptomyces sp. PB17]|uniref:hypothetical protein n=1 Tax=Streptomyces sp. PB17 TaxID=3384158 RepID=UPI0038B49D3A
VSTYLALTFGTLLSSQGTDASFVLTQEILGLSSGRFPSVLRFRLYQILFDPIPCRRDLPIAFVLSLVGLSTFTTLADLSVDS